MVSSPLYIGLMSGTSLDGVDGVLTDFANLCHAVHVPFDSAFRDALLALQAPGENEIHREALAAHQLAQHYAACVQQLLANAHVDARAVVAIGAHGQTIRHRPQDGYTRQLNHPALLAELSGISVVADFRSRDIAAGGQGAPLVPAFHQARFGAPGKTRVVANIGGIANLSILNADGSVLGYDTGPGNVLMDAWVHEHRGTHYDANGDWAASGTPVADLLNALLAEPYFAAPAPKSTGRDLFHRAWLAHHLASHAATAPADVQATLAALTAHSLAAAIRRDAGQAEAVYVCGGGARNAYLMTALQSLLTMPVLSTDALGVPPDQVEALAFAWLAMRCCERLPGNLPTVTGARGPRILGALYPA